MNIESAVLDVLSNATMDGNSLKLTGQLDRPLYVATNKVLEAAGGKWNRKAQSHLFDGEAAEIMDQIILTGKVSNKKQELGQFFSPSAVVERVIELANIEADQRVLEPNVGSGNIAHAVFASAPIHLVVVETDAALLDKFTSSYTSWPHSRIHAYLGDFLTMSPDTLGKFERIVMNPPFAKNVSPSHVLKALTLLKPNGRLVSVMPSSVTFRTDTLNRMVRAAVEAGGSIEALPENSFAESGTNVNTVIVTMQA
jgi:type I restriction-modification system DNA methylase subunit